MLIVAVVLAKMNSQIGINCIHKKKKIVGIEFEIHSAYDVRRALEWQKHNR